jgi:cell wall-associated NlpC family hydrolase
MGAMKCAHIALVAILLCGIALPAAHCQNGQSADDSTAVLRKSKHKHPPKDAALSSDERLAVLASALDSKTPRFTERDCSHLVHAIYERAGFPYGYADSDDLYDGVEGFQRVSDPQLGDLVVWHGHAGIVVRPSRHIFYSFLHAGPGIDDYTSHYWKGRGQPRFYRYIKNTGCKGCTVARGPGR